MRSLTRIPAIGQPTMSGISPYLLADIDWQGRTLTPLVAAKNHKVLQVGFSVNLPGRRHGTIARRR